jgi:hypothetical protein
MADPKREFHLLRLKDGSLKLTEYFPVTDAKADLRAFVFSHGNYSYAVLWHRTDKALLKLELDNAKLLECFDGDEAEIPAGGIKLDNRIYLKTSASLEQLKAALLSAELAPIK